MATDTATPAATLVERIRELAALGWTDARIAMRLGIHPDKVKRIRQANGILAGFYLDKAAGSQPLRKRTAVNPRPPGPLTPAEVEALRAKHADSVRGRPAKRGWCRSCQEWLLLNHGLLPEHTRRTTGVERRQAPRCDNSIRRPARGL